jgi:hypothetical protein
MANATPGGWEWKYISKNSSGIKEQGKPDVSVVIVLGLPQITDAV